MRKVGLASEDLRHLFAHEGHPGAATDEHHLVQIRRTDMGIAQRPQAVLSGAGYPWQRQFFQIGPRDGNLDALLRPDKRQRHLCGFLRGQPNLRLLGRLDQTHLHRHGQGGKDWCLWQIRTLPDPVGDEAIHIVATELRIARSGEHLKEALPHLKHRDIESAATEVIDGDFRALSQLIQPIGQGRRRGLAHDALDRQPCQLTRFFCGRPLGIVEVSGHGDHRPFDRLLEGALGDTAESFQNLRRYLDGCDAQGPQVIGRTPVTLRFPPAQKALY